MDRLNIKIGINATCFDDRPSGAKNRFIGIYSKIFKKLNKCKFYVYEAENVNISEWFENNDNIFFIKTNIPSYGGLTKYFKSIKYWYFNKKNIQVDIFETFHLPVYKNTSINLLTVHDLRPFQSNNLLFKILFFLVLKVSLKRSKRIITVSNYIKNLLSKYEKADKIYTVYNGLLIHNDLEYSKKIINKLKIKKKFILSVGHFEKRKNYVNLIKAFSNNYYLKENYELVIVGNDNGYKDIIIKLIKTLKMQKKIRLISNLSDTELKYIYQKSQLFVFPSFYEGFGIPLIEAMFYQLPIATSNLEVLKEISEYKVSYFDPKNILDISNKIENLIKSKQDQNKQIDNYKNILKKFDYNKIANQIVNIYESVTRE